MNMNPSSRGERFLDP